MKNLRGILTSLALASVIALPSFAYAQTGAGDGGDGLSFRLNGFTGTPGADANLLDVIHNIINVLLVLVALVAVIYLILGGLKYITSGGDDSKAEEAKNTILFALIGLVVIGLSVVVVNFVLNTINNVSGA